MRALGYCRVSSLEQATGTSLRDQQAAIEAHAAAVAAGEAVSQRGRYASCDPRWSSDFNGQIDAYIAKTGTEVLADFRGHDPGCR